MSCKLPTGTFGKPIKAIGRMGYDHKIIVTYDRTFNWLERWLILVSMGIKITNVRM